MKHQTILSELYELWDQIALFAYSQYCESGRGVVALDWAGSGEARRAMLRYVRFPPGQPDKEVERLTDTYDPDDEILVMFSDETGRVHTQRLRTGPEGRAPKRVWCFEMLRRLQQDPESLPDQIPEWFWGFVDRLADALEVDHRHQAES